MTEISLRFWEWERPRAKRQVLEASVWDPFSSSFRRAFAYDVPQSPDQHDGITVGDVLTPGLAALLAVGVR